MGIHKTISRSGWPIEPALARSHPSPEALTRAKAQMHENSIGVREEIGFLTIHQRYADRVFPGTLAPHTHAHCAALEPFFKKASPAAGRLRQQLLVEPKVEPWLCSEVT